MHKILLALLQRRHPSLGSSLCRNRAERYSCRDSLKKIYSHAVYPRLICDLLPPSLSLAVEPATGGIKRGAEISPLFPNQLQLVSSQCPWTDGLTQVGTPASGGEARRGCNWSGEGGTGWLGCERRRNQPDGFQFHNQTRRDAASNKLKGPQNYR